MVYATPWLTTANRTKLLAKQPVLYFVSDRPLGENRVIDVDESVAYQEIAGFGAAVTESSAYLLWSQLATTTRGTTLNKLFNRSTGIGLSYLRVPMGASDFALGNYTYQDNPNNPVSVARDDQYVVPLIKQAAAINPEIRIMGTPWSAPAWMKDSASLLHGRLKTDMHLAYANYLLSFVAQYQQRGILVDALTLVNEPHHEAWTYPSMAMSSAQARELLSHAVGPMLQQSGVKLLCWDHNWDDINHPLDVLADPLARGYVWGTAFHCYAGHESAQSALQSAHSDKGIYFTECTGTSQYSDFGANLRWNASHLMIGATRHWAKTILLWNLALDAAHGPQNGGCTNCRGVVTVATPSSVALNVEYYALGHLSKFVRPGAVRIKSNTYPYEDLESVAFRNVNGSKVLVLLNGSWSATYTVKIRWQGQVIKVTLAPGTLGTYVW